jgi:hypothetical protein
MDALVTRMLDKDPSQRPTAARVAIELDRTFQELVAVRDSGAPAARRSRRRTTEWRWMNTFFGLARRIFVRRRA